jgi:16S rRNA processing protein RimM
MRAVTVGEVRGSYGVRGWVKVHSYTAPPENILQYGPWVLEGQDFSCEYAIVEGHLHGRTVIAALEGVTTPEEAQSLRGARVLVDRARFPPTVPGEFYRVDLLGLTVRCLDGGVLGVVKDLLETGANDVLVVEGERERLVPFVQGRTVTKVDLEAGEILVDWDRDF